MLSCTLLLMRLSGSTHDIKHTVGPKLSARGDNSSDLWTVDFEKEKMEWCFWGHSYHLHVSLHCGALSECCLRMGFPLPSLCKSQSVAVTTQMLKAHKARQILHQKSVCSNGVNENITRLNTEKHLKQCYTMSVNFCEAFCLSVYHIMKVSNSQDQCACSLQKLSK